MTTLIIQQQIIKSFEDIADILHKYHIAYDNVSPTIANDLIKEHKDSGFAGYDTFLTEEYISMKPHYHNEVEARFILEGGGVFNFRCEDGNIELHVFPGDYIVIPKSMIHEFKTNFIKALRFFPTDRTYQAHYVD
jgi:cupin superfamily acireductone dioxygenase involved in methionine salvage